LADAREATQGPFPTRRGWWRGADDEGQDRLAAMSLRDRANTRIDQIRVGQVSLMVDAGSPPTPIGAAELSCDATMSGPVPCMSAPTMESWYGYDERDREGIREQGVVAQNGVAAR
jgi:hypothetical protein